MASRKKGDEGRRVKKSAKASDVRRVLRGDGSKESKKRPLAQEDLYGGGVNGNLLQGDYAQRPEILDLIQKRHASGTGWIDKDGFWNRNGHRWKVPYGMREALTERLMFSQLVNRYPFYATWISPKNGKRLKKSFSSLPAAIDFVASKAQYADSDASVVSRHGFFIPRKLMGKFPRKMGDPPRTRYWCPRCMQPRQFKQNGEEFFAMKKHWDEVKARYVWRDRKLAVLCCTVCDGTNRDNRFRASNQPVEKRKFKQGVRRARRKR